MAIQYKIYKGKSSALNKVCNKQAGFIAVEPISGYKNLWRLVYDDGKGDDFHAQMQAMEAKLKRKVD